MEKLWNRKDMIHTLAGVAQLVGYCPTKWKVAGSIPGQHTCLGCIPPQVGAHARGYQLIFLPHIDVSLPFSLSSPLSKNK